MIRARILPTKVLRYQILFCLTFQFLSHATTIWSTLPIFAFTAALLIC